MMEEIRRLAILVDEFERPFHPDQMMLSVYKKVLHSSHFCWRGELGSLQVQLDILLGGRLQTIVCHCSCGAKFWGGAVF